MPRKAPYGNRPCPTCCGNGVDERGHECPDCEGTGCAGYPFCGCQHEDEGARDAR